MDYSADMFRRRKFKKRMDLPMYQMLAASGELETLKSHIRSKLILELNKSRSRAVHDNLNKSRLADQYTSLASKLIISHLIVRQYEYTLSVFVPECGLAPNEVYCLGRDGQAQLLEPENLLSEMKSLELARTWRTMNKDQSPLEFLLQFIEQKSANASVCAGVQTEEDLPYQFYDDRLQNIDRVFESRRCLNLQSARETIENQVDEMRREMEVQFAEKLNYEIDRFRTSRQVELEKQINEKYQVMLQDTEKKLREDYERRITSLSENHKQMQRQMDLSRQADEREAFLRRQSMQTEVESLRSQLAQLNEEKGQLIRKRREMETDYNRRQTELDLRDKELIDKEQCLENRVQMEVNKMRFDDEQRMLHKEKELEYKAAEIEDNRTKLKREMNFVTKLKSDLIEQKSKFFDMEIADYALIKNQNDSLKAEVDVLHGQLNTALKTIQEQKRQLTTLQAESAAYHAANAEVEELRNMLTNVQKQFSEERIQLSSRIMEQKIQMQRLVKHLTLAESEIYDSSQHPFEKVTSSQKTSCIGFNQSPGFGEMNSVLPAESESTTVLDPWSDRLKETKKRMHRLQAESEQLESAYDRWCVSNPSSLVRLEYEKLVNGYLKESATQKVVIPTADLVRIAPSQIESALQTADFASNPARNEKNRKVEVSPDMRASQKEEAEHGQSQKITSREKPRSTSVSVRNGAGISLVYDDTGVSARTHTSRSEISLEIDDRLHPHQDEDCRSTKTLEKSINDSTRALGMKQPSNGLIKSSVVDNIGHTLASGKISYREYNEIVHSNTDHSTDISECIEDAHLEDLLTACENQLTDDENTTVDENANKATTEDAYKEDDANADADAGADKSGDSHTLKRRSSRTADGSGSDDLIQRYLELSKTTNRVSEAARIEEEQNEGRSKSFASNGKCEKTTMLTHFLSNPEFISSDTESNISGCHEVPELDDLSTGREKSDPSETAW